MDAREKWMKQAMQLATIFLFEGRRNDDATPMLKQAGDNLQAHLRTTPEGFALVPVTEWVPFDENSSYPAPESSGWFWYIKDDGTTRFAIGQFIPQPTPADNGKTTNPLVVRYFDTSVDQPFTFPVENLQRPSGCGKKHRVIVILIIVDIFVMP